MTDSKEQRKTISINEFMDILKYLSRAELPESKPAIKVGELRDLILKINFFDVSEWIQGQILGLLERKRGNDYIGATAPQIWQTIRSQKEGRLISIDIIEKQIERLLQEDIIYKNNDAQMTLYFITPSGLEKVELENVDGAITGLSITTG